MGKHLFSKQEHFLRFYPQNLSERMLRVLSLCSCESYFCFVGERLWNWSSILEISALLIFPFQSDPFHLIVIWFFGQKIFYYASLLSELRY